MPAMSCADGAAAITTARGTDASGKVPAVAAAVRAAAAAPKPHAGATPGMPTREHHQAAGRSTLRTAPHPRRQRRQRRRGAGPGADPARLTVPEQPAPRPTPGATAHRTAGGRHRIVPHPGLHPAATRDREATVRHAAQLHVRSPQDRPVPTELQFAGAAPNADLGNLTNRMGGKRHHTPKMLWPGGEALQAGEPGARHPRALLLVLRSTHQGDR